MIRFFIISLFSFTFFSLAAIAAEKPVTIEVTGEAVGSDLESPRELFERAKNEAQRTAIEQAVGTFTRKEEPLLHGGFKEGFKVYDGKSTGLVSDLLKRLAQLENSDWGETTLLYRISPAK